MRGITVDYHGNTFIVGAIPSGKSEASYPSGSPFEDIDAFVTKLDEDGNAVWTRVLGGNDYDYCEAIAVSEDGSVHITGHTLSPDFPVRNAYDSTYIGGDNGHPKDSQRENGYESWGEAFVAELSPEGEVVWSTYLGGSAAIHEPDRGRGIAVDKSGNVYVCGEGGTGSFPVIGPHAQSHPTSSNGFLSKFSPNGQLLWSTYLEYVPRLVQSTWDLILMEDGGILTFGRLPETQGTKSSEDRRDAQQKKMGDIYLTLFDPEGAVKWTESFGGSKRDTPTALAMASSGEIFVAGWTQSSDLATSGAPDPVYQCNVDQEQMGLFDPGDGFLARLSSSGEIACITYIGSSGQDGVLDISVDPNGDLLLLTKTDSREFFYGMLDLAKEREPLEKRMDLREVVIRYSSSIPTLRSYNMDFVCASSSDGRIAVQPDGKVLWVFNTLHVKSPSSSRSLGDSTATIHAVRFPSSWSGPLPPKEIQPLNEEDPRTVRHRLVVATTRIHFSILLLAVFAAVWHLARYGTVQLSPEEKANRNLSAVITGRILLGVSLCGALVVVLFGQSSSPLTASFSCVSAALVLWIALPAGVALSVMGTVIWRRRAGASLTWTIARVLTFGTMAFISLRALFRLFS